MEKGFQARRRPEFISLPEGVAEEVTVVGAEVAGAVVTVQRAGLAGMAGQPMGAVFTSRTDRSL